MSMRELARGLRGLGEHLEHFWPEREMCRGYALFYSVLQSESSRIRRTKRLVSVVVPLEPRCIATGKPILRNMKESFIECKK